VWWQRPRDATTDPATKVDIGSSNRDITRQRSQPPLQSWVQRTSREEISMAIALPTSADVRKARSQADKFVNAQWDVVRDPVLAWLGAGDLAVHNLREMPARLRPENLRTRADDITDRARKVYETWIERGEDTLEWIRTQPEVNRAITGARDTDRQVTGRVEKIVDELHDAGQELLDKVSFESRSVGEKSARRAQRVSRRAADAVTDISGGVASEIEHAGDQAAHGTRGASRKAANRTAPAENTPGRRTATATT
jgi:heparin binding hemagglutinin HbhA